MRTHALARAGLLAGLVTGVASCLPSPCVIDDDCPVGAYCKGATVVRTADGEVDDEKSTDGACSFGSNPDGTSSSSGGGGSSGVTGGSSGVTGGSSGVTGGSSGVSNGSSTMSGSSGVSGATSTPVGSSSSTTTGGTSVASGGSSSTNSSGVSGASSVDMSSSGSASGGSVGSSSVTGTSSGVVGSSSVGGGSSSGVAGSSSVGGSSSSGSPAPATMVLEFPDPFMVVSQSAFIVRGTVTNETNGDIYLVPTLTLHVRPSTGGQDLAGYFLVPFQDTVTRRLLTARQSISFYMNVDVANSPTVPANRLVRMTVDVPWALAATGPVDAVTIVSAPSRDLTVLAPPVASGLTLSNAAAPNGAGVASCPQLCFDLSQQQGKPMDVVVEYERGGQFQRATQVSGAFDRRSHGTVGLLPGTHCFSWNAPLNLGGLSSAITFTMRVTPVLHGVAGLPTSSGPGSFPSTIKQCGADFHAPISLHPQRGTTALAVADLDLDGQPDVVQGTAAGTNFLNVQRGIGGGAFELCPDETPLARTVSNIAIGFFNADDKPDVVTGERGSLRLFTSGAGSGPAANPGIRLSTLLSFSPSTEDPSALRTADLDGDGISEILYTYQGLNELNMARISGATLMPITWAPLVDVVDFDVVDLDLDGFQDVVAVTQPLTSGSPRMVNGPARIEIMRGGPGALVAGAPFVQLLGPAALGTCIPDGIRVGHVDAGSGTPLVDLVVVCRDVAAGSRPVVVAHHQEDGTFDVVQVTTLVTSGALGIDSLTLGEFDDTPGVDLMVTLGSSTTLVTNMVPLEAGTDPTPLPPMGRGHMAVDLNHDGHADLVGWGDLPSGEARALAWRYAGGTYGGHTVGQNLTSVPDRLFAQRLGGSNGDNLLGFHSPTGTVYFWSRVDTAPVTVNLGLTAPDTAVDVAPGPLTPNTRIVVATSDGVGSRVRTYDVSSAGLATTGPTAATRTNPVAMVATGFHTSTSFMDAITVSGGGPRVLQYFGGGSTTIGGPNSDCNAPSNVTSHAVGRVGNLAVVAATQTETAVPLADTAYYTTSSSTGVNCTGLRPVTPTPGRNPNGMVFVNAEAAFASSAAGNIRRVHIQRLRDNGGALAADGEQLAWTAVSSGVRLGVGPLGGDPDADLFVQSDGAVEIFRRNPMTTPPTYDPALALFGPGATTGAGPRHADLNGDGVVDLVWIAQDGTTTGLRVVYGY